MPKPDDLTERQWEWLQALHDLGFQPSLAEWGEAMGATFNPAKIMRDTLIRLGYVEYTPGKWRSMVLTEKGKKAVNADA